MIALGLQEVCETLALCKRKHQAFNGQDCTVDVFGFSLKEIGRVNYLRSEIN